MSQPLSGGNMSGALRVGDTVRRDAGPWTPTVHRLLEHLRAHGVPGVPKPHGLDQHGREVLEFLPGEVPSYPMPAWVWNDDLLVSAARWLRRFHDATTDLSRGGERWQLPDHPPVEVICHNDFAPYNMVFDAEHRLVGVIDFDTCSPGSRVWDLAYLAYRIVPFHTPGTLQTPTTAAAQRVDRLKLLCDSYGRPSPATSSPYSLSASETSTTSPRFGPPRPAPPRSSTATSPRTRWTLPTWASSPPTSNAPV